MWKPRRKTILKLTRIIGATTTAALLLAISVRVASSGKKEKTYLPDFVVKADTVLVVILPGEGEPLNDPAANQKAKEEVEKAMMKWGRYRLALDKNWADLVIGVRKGTGKIANPTISGGGVDKHPGTIETTEDSVRIGAQRGRPPAVSQGDSSSGPVRTGVEAGAENDVLKVFQGGANIPFPVDGAPLWTHVAKDGLKPPRMAAVEEFRKAVEESEKAATQRQQQKQQKAQKRNP